MQQLMNQFYATPRIAMRSGAGKRQGLSLMQHEDYFIVSEFRTRLVTGVDIQFDLGIHSQMKPPQ